METQNNRRGKHRTREEGRATYLPNSRPVRAALSILHEPVQEAHIVVRELTVHDDLHDVGLAVCMKHAAEIDEDCGWIELHKIVRRSGYDNDGVPTVRVK